MTCRCQWGKAYAYEGCGFLRRLGLNAKIARLPYVPVWVMTLQNRAVFVHRAEALVFGIREERYQVFELVEGE